MDGDWYGSTVKDINFGLPDGIGLRDCPSVSVEKSSTYVCVVTQLEEVDFIKE